MMSLVTGAALRHVDLVVDGREQFSYDHEHATEHGYLCQKQLKDGRQMDFIPQVIHVTAYLDITYLEGHYARTVQHALCCSTLQFAN